MKLLSCYVYAFGKLKNYTHVFDETLTVIEKENGWGKSTLAIFLKAMFYGLNGTRKNIEDNERLRYMPWGSQDKFGGYVEFRWRGKTYKLERYFGARSSSDTCKIYDVETGKECDGERIGEKIFNIDEDGFLSTIMYSDSVKAVKSSASLTAKFDMANSEQSSTTFDKAYNKIQAKAKEYKAERGNGGLLAQISSNINTIDTNIKQVESDIEDINQCKKILPSIQEKAKVFKDKLISASNCNVVINIDELKRKELTEEYNELLVKKHQCEYVFNGKAIEKCEVENCARKIDQLEQLNGKISAYNATARNTKESSPNSLRVGVGVFLFLFLGCLIMAIVSVWQNSARDFMAVAFFIASGICFLLSIILSVKVRVNRKTHNHQQDHVANVRYYEQLSLQVKDFLSQFNLPSNDCVTAINQLAQLVSKYEEICFMLKNVEQKLADLCKTNTENNKKNANAFNDELNIIEHEYEQCLEQCAQINAKIKTLESKEYLLFKLKKEREETKEKYEQMMDEYETCILTAKYLKIAEDNVKKKYRFPVTESINKYLSFIAPTISAEVDIDLNVIINENTGTKQVEFFSEGFKDIFDICKHFALLDVLYINEKPFIILDDPFVHLDEEKMIKALDLVKRISGEYQIIYFTCHESRRPINEI